MPAVFDISAGRGVRVFRGVTTSVLDPTGGGEELGDLYGEYISLLMHFNPDFPVGAVVVYKLDNLLDSSGNDNTLTESGSVVFVPGKSANCAQFDGSSYLGAGYGVTPSINPSGSFSVSFWCYPTTLYNYGAFVSANSLDNNGFNIHTSSDGTLYFNNAQAADCTLANVFNANIWHHIVCQKNAASGKLIVYKNGIKLYEENSSQPYGTNLNRITIGGYRYPGTNNSSQPQIGKIDSVGVWNRILSQEEVLALYNSGNGLEP